MKTLVTGGAGFIGSHLAQALSRQGAQVVVLDNLSLGTLDNLSWRKPGDPLEFVEGDVANETLLNKVIAGCQWVFHQAAWPSVPRSIAEPLASNDHNLDATLKLLVAARDGGVKRFLFASSSAIYGDSKVAAKRESLPPKPLSPYALQKYAAEKYCQLFYELYGLETVSLRYFNVFGPRQGSDSPYSGVIARFCTALLSGQRPVVYGDGRQSRDFTFIDNAVSANLLAAQAPAEKVAGKIFNVAGGKSITLLQLLRELERITGRRTNPVFEAPRPGDVRSSRADITAARKMIGYQPKVSCQEGLKRTLQFYRMLSK